MAKANGNRKSQLVNIKYSRLANGQFDDEVVVTLTASIGDINMILPYSFLDQSNETIKAIIIGQEEDKYLIGLPNDTFTTGSKVWFSKSMVKV